MVDIWKIADYNADVNHKKAQENMVSAHRETISRMDAEVEKMKKLGF